MTFQKMLRTQLIITGLGAAALLFAGSARAQEITNTEFNDGPYVVAFAQAPQPASAQVSQASTPVSAQLPVTEAAVVSMPVVPDEDVVSPVLARWIVAGILFIALGVIMFYCASELNALAELRRANRSLRARTTARMSPRAV